MLLIGYFNFLGAQAAVINNREVRISSSIPGATTDYDFLGDTTSVDNMTACIKMQFCASPNTAEACVAPTNINAGGAYVTSSAAWNVWTYAAWSINTTSTNSVTITHSDGGQVGGEASSWVIGGIVNPNAGVFYAWLNTYGNVNCSTGPFDNGVVATASVTGVTVSATILETLSFTVAQVASGTCTVSGGTNVTTTSTTVPFGTINSNTFYNGCQSLTVGTNASSGYDTTIAESDQLTSTTPDALDEIADGVCDSSCTETTAAAWGNSNNNGFGYCMDDVSGNGAATADAAWATYYCGAGTQYFKIFPNLSESETKEIIMQSASSASGDNAYVGYRLSVDGDQPAGTYTNTTSYIVTPKY